MPSLQYLPSSCCLRAGLFTIDVRSFGSTQKMIARTAFVQVLFCSVLCCAVLCGTVVVRYGGGAVVVLVLVVVVVVVVVVGRCGRCGRSWRSWSSGVVCDRRVQFW